MIIRFIKKCRAEGHNKDYAFKRCSSVMLTNEVKKMVKGKSKEAGERLGCSSFCL